jgi:uncharacterized protein (DUF2249 family)
MNDAICGFVIESGVPIPDRYRPRSAIGIALEALEPGQSFVVKDAYDCERIRSRMAKMRPKHFSLRKIPNGGWRVWRTE